MSLKRSQKKNQPAKVRYNMEKRWISNKIKKLEKHLEKYGKDEYAKKALKKLQKEGIIEKREEQQIEQK